MQVTQGKRDLPEDTQQTVPKAELGPPSSVSCTAEGPPKAVSVQRFPPALGLHGDPSEKQ